MGDPRRAKGRQAQVKNGFAPKICPVCQRPFEWRRAWARDWDRVIYCSQRCRGSRTQDDGDAKVSST